MIKSYSLILFDFFNTLVTVNPSALPTLEINGRREVTTAGLVEEVLRPHAPKIGAEQIHKALKQAGEQIRTLRGEDLKEVTSQERFRLALEALGLQNPPEALARAMVQVHMAALEKAFHFPDSHQNLIDALGQSHRLAIFSNFDHAPTVYGILQKYNMRDRFDPVVISDEIGYRKPGARAFGLAQEICGVPGEDLLFVGDSLKADVGGAEAAGWDVAWINAGDESPGDFVPTHTIRALPELTELLA